MKIIKPINITQDSLVYSNVPMDDAPLWGASEVFEIGDKCIYEINVY